jgi:hypothetical protein
MLYGLTKKSLLTGKILQGKNKNIRISLYVYNLSDITTMKILESTERRLVLEIENDIFCKLVYLSLWVNALVTICFVAISENSPALRYVFLILFSTVGWLLIYFLLPKKARDNDYLFEIIFFAIPILGFGVLLMIAVVSICITPQIASLTFDKDENLLTIKKVKILSWYPVTQYPLDEIIEVTLGKKYVHTSAMNGVVRPIAWLSRRRKNGRILQKNILANANANHSVVNQINKFLMTMEGR